MATNWGQIHTLQARLKYHEVKFHFRRGRYAKWEKAIQTAKHWKNKKAQARAEANAAKWHALIRPEAEAIGQLQAEIKKLLPKTQLYHAGGWVKPGSPFSMQRCDQGQDFEIPRYTAVIAPAAGRCIEYASDRPWPSGFGSPYAIVEFFSGPFSGRQWYIGHANRPIIRPGQTFHEGQPLSILNNGFTSYWGWTEIGVWPPRSMAEGFLHRSLFKDVWK